MMCANATIPLPLLLSARTHCIYIYIYIYIYILHIIWYYVNIYIYIDRYVQKVIFCLLSVMWPLAPGLQSFAFGMKVCLWDEALPYVCTAKQLASMYSSLFIYVYIHHICSIYMFCKYIIYIYVYVHIYIYIYILASLLCTVETVFSLYLLIFLFLSLTLLFLSFSYTIVECFSPIVPVRALGDNFIFQLGLLSQV